MGHICNSIIINAPYDKVFEVSNDLSRWTEFRPQFSKVESLGQEGNKITFQLTHNNQMSWKAYRLLFKDEKFVYAEKLTPSPPFVYMKMIWLYREVNGGVEMTWIDDFEVEKGAKHSDEETARLMGKHSQSNLEKFKELVEKSNNGQE